MTTAIATSEIIAADERAAPRIMATVHFQVWQNNYAVPVDQATFDATTLYEGMSDEDRAAIEDNRDTSDNIYLDAVEKGLAPAWLQAGLDRCFYVDIEDAIAVYREALDETADGVAA